MAWAHGLLVAVVTLERTHTEGVDDLTHALLGIEKTAVAVEPRPRDFETVFANDDDPLAQAPDGPGGTVSGPVQSDGALGRPEDVDDLDTEAGGRLLDDVR